MAMIITSDSHLDHNLTVGQLEYLKKYFQDRDGFFIETVELPYGTVPCGLIGPATEQGVVEEGSVFYAIRPPRKWASRVLDPAKGWTSLMTTKVTVIAGPAGAHACVLYTAYGGPAAPREPGDPSISSWEELQNSREFWSKHALIMEVKR
jgi:hypothetical protein